MFAVALGLVLPVWAGPRILGLRRAAAAGSTAQATAMGISETMAQGTESHRPADLHTEAVLVASATPTPTPTPAPTSTPKPPPATKFFTVAPCRVADTRRPTGPWGGPALRAGFNRSFVIGGRCGVPTGAKAGSFNFTITLPTASGDVRIFPGAALLPVVSTVNWGKNQTRADNAVIGLGPNTDITTHVDQASGTVHFIIDVNGYYQ
jgi:serine protease